MDGYFARFEISRVLALIQQTDTQI